MGNVNQRNQADTAPGVGAAQYVYNPSASLGGPNWNRLRDALLGENASGIGIGAAANYILNAAGTSFNRWAVPSGDTLASAFGGVGPMAYNGTNWDRARSTPSEVTLLASAARTTTQTSADLVAYDGRSLSIVVDMTVVGTGSITMTVNMKDTASGKYILLLAGAAITTNSTNRYRVTPDLAAVANSIAQDFVPRVFQIVITANNANSATYSVGYHLHN